jgi:drug/metabolite transporter (DMT)-like permease
MVRPGSGALQWAILFPLGAAVCGGLRDLITRKISATETTMSVLAVTTTVVLLAGLTTAPFGWNTLRATDLILFAASGGLIATAHTLMIEAFRRGEAALVAPYKYSSLIWAVLIGFLMFGTLPDGWTLAGGGIIIGAGLYVLRRELRASARAKAAGS